jgi:hypothetical protein
MSRNLSEATRVIFYNRAIGFAVERTLVATPLSATSRLPLPIRQDNSNSRRACFFDLAGETAIFTLSPSAVRKPNSRSKE